jgi:hypothetical protein
VFSATPRMLYPRERSGTHCTEAGWAPGPVWTGAENLAPTGIRSPDRPAHSQSLYRLSYTALHNTESLPNSKPFVQGKGKYRPVMCQCPHRGRAETYRKVPMPTQRESRDIDPLCLTSVPNRGWAINSTPGLIYLLPP